MKEGTWERHIRKNEGTGRAIHSDLLRAWLQDMKDDFPIAESPSWNTPEEELARWKKVSLDGQSREVASWIRGRIKTLEWLLEYFGEEK